VIAQIGHVVVVHALGDTQSIERAQALDLEDHARDRGLDATPLPDSTGLSEHEAQDDRRVDGPAVQPRWD
jgi:hypothetical protein